MNETDEAAITRLRQRMEGWGLNEESAWLTVRLGELRAVFRALDASHAPPRKRKELSQLLVEQQREKELDW